MKELKTDPKLKALFKPLSKEKLEELEEKISKKYDGTPLYVWKGNIIVDGHNRYPLMKKYNIDFNTEDVEDFLGEDCTKADVMQWMISHQDARRNLSPGELIYANSMVAEEIALENKEKMSIGGKVGADITNKKTPCVQMDTPRDYSTNTRQQVAKMSGVGTGTVARYDAIMKTDNEDLKKKVQTGEVKIGTAYREIKQAEKNSSKVNGIYKEIANSYAGTQHSGHFGEFCDTKKTTDKNFTQDDVVRAYKDTKVLKNALDMLDIRDEFDTIEEDIKQRINTYKNRLFNVYDIQKKNNI